MTRHQLQEMLSRIPDAQVPRLGQIIQDFIEDEMETLSPGDLEAIRIGREEVQRGEVASFEDVLAQNGLDYNNL